MNQPDYFFLENVFPNNQDIFDYLMKNIQWKQDFISFSGKTIPIPRLQAWYGDEGKVYTYSGIKMEPLVWTSTLLSLKEIVDDKCKTKFNSVLLNLYRDGNDSISWHSDDEPELGEQPIIGSVSFGEPRDFFLKEKKNPDNKIKINLSNNSLLCMFGDTQKDWLHGVPKRKNIDKPRINLTFRTIV